MYSRAPLVANGTTRPSARRRPLFSPRVKSVSVLVHETDIRETVPATAAAACSTRRRLMLLGPFAVHAACQCALCSSAL